MIGVIPVTVVVSGWSAECKDLGGRTRCPLLTVSKRQATHTRGWIKVCSRGDPTKSKLFEPVHPVP